MPQITSAAEAAASRQEKSLANGTRYHKTEFHRSAADGPSVQAQGFLVEQEPNSTILPHFHVQNQFQVIVGGGGRLGQHEVRPVSVHFAGAHTAYGPIVSGPEGIAYFTLRDGHDPGARFMPGARKELQRGLYRFELIGDIAVDSAEAMRQRRAPAVETVLEPEADGLAAQIVRLGPGTAAESLDPASGGGQYHLVLAGSLRQDGRSGGDLPGGELPVNSCIFVGRDEAPPRFAAGADGATMLVLQFPRRD